MSDNISLHLLFFSPTPPVPSLQSPAPYSVRNLSESSLTQYELDSKSSSRCRASLSIALHLLECHLSYCTSTHYTICMIIYCERALHNPPTQLLPLRGRRWEAADEFLWCVDDFNLSKLPHQFFFFFLVFSVFLFHFNHRQIFPVSPQQPRLFISSPHNSSPSSFFVFNLWCCLATGVTVTVWSLQSNFSPPPLLFLS